MNHIEEMMKTAGVKKCENFRQYNYAQVSYGKEELKKSQDNGIECIRIRNCIDDNNTCIYWTELFYPSFTAEKQLEIIKLIAQESILKMLSMPISKSWEISVGPSGKYGGNMDFTQAIAQLTTELMKLGELDKEKVKEVLER